MPNSNHSWPRLLRSVARSGGAALSLLGALLALAGCGGGVSSQYQPQGQVDRFDNADWQKVLRAAVTTDGYVKYDVLTDNRDGVRDALYRYVGLIGAVSPDNRPELFPAREDKLAYYLNAYNALAMYAVLKRGLPANTIVSGLPGSIYLVDTFPVGGHGITLHNLEGKIREYEDPRIHFAINCMSNSCPPLRNEAYDGHQLDGQLADQGKRYMSDSRGLKAGTGENVELGGIFGMYDNDFVNSYRKKTGKKDATLLEAVKEYAPDGSAVKDAKGMKIMGYDWGLNRAKPGSTTAPANP
jgi:hypothetical protein